MMVMRMMNVIMMMVIVMMASNMMMTTHLVTKIIVLRSGESGSCSMTAWFRNNVISCITTISACQKVRQWEGALLLMSKHQVRGMTTKLISFSKAILACEKGEQWEAFLSIPNVISCNAAISACEKSRQWEDTLSLLSKLGRGCYAKRDQQNAEENSIARSECEFHQKVTLEIAIQKYQFQDQHMSFIRRSILKLPSKNVKFNIIV